MENLKLLALPIMLACVVLSILVRRFTAGILNDMDGFGGEVSGEDLVKDGRIIKRL